MAFLVELVAWSDGRSGSSFDIYGTTVSPSGTVAKASGTAFSTAANDQSYPSARADGTTWYLVWQDARNAGSTDIYGTRVTSAGAASTPAGTAPTSVRWPPPTSSASPRRDAS